MYGAVFFFNIYIFHYLSQKKKRARLDGKLDFFFWGGGEGEGFAFAVLNRLGKLLG